MDCPITELFADCSEESFIFEGRFLYCLFLVSFLREEARAEVGGRVAIGMWVGVGGCAGVRFEDVDAAEGGGKVGSGRDNI